MRDAAVVALTKSLGSLTFAVADVLKSNGLHGQWALENAEDAFIDLDFEIRTIARPSAAEDEVWVAKTSVCVTLAFKFNPFLH